MYTRLFVFAIVGLFCLATVYGATESIIVANFVETKSDQPGSHTSGKLYYYYNPNDVNSSRLRFEYTSFGASKTISNLYHYKDDAIYSMCSDACTGLRITEKPDPWWYDTNVYNKGAMVGSLYTFTRKPLASSSKFTAQVSSIVMSEQKSATNQISKIVFADGRIVTLSDVKLNPADTPKTSTKFTVDRTDCPKPTCPIYADLIFVLDNSNSVSDSSWRKGGDFVDAVMQSFTFGIDGVEAAIIQFNAPPAYPCTKGGCSKCINDYQFVSGYAYPGYATAEITAGYDYGSGLSVSENRIALETVMNGTRPKRSGQTCQGYGLELAMRVLDRSPRRAYTKKPQPIVIAVTDGADWCPNRTADAAEKLRKDYGAFVAEIGVGLDSGCNDYDKNYLRRIASKIGSGDTPAYYDVSDYGAIHAVTEQLFKPICDGYNTQCGPDCHGFCGCGKCLCPTCDDTGSSCLKSTCAADGTSSTGCVNSSIPCETPDDICTQYICRGDKTGSERCEAQHNPCTDLNNNNKEECREVLCNPSAGGCYVNYRDNYCPSNACEKYKCARPEDKTTGAGVVYNSKTGCLLVRNITAEKEEQLKKDKKNCFRATCNKNTGVTGEEDICASDYPKCYSSTCVLDGTSYTCKESNLNRPTDTACIKYECSADKSKGWVVKSKEDEDTCTELYKGQGKDLRCKNIYCDDDAGCTMSAIKGCSIECNDTMVQKCIADSFSKSTTAYCILPTCQAKEVGEAMWDVFCNFTSSHENCFEKMEKQLQELTKADPDVCYQPICTENGRCSYEEIERPDYMVNTACMQAVCVEATDKSWHWEYHPTLANTSCLPDDCTYRECQPDSGCVETDTCRTRTTECDSFSCEIINNEPTCVSTSLLIETNCTKEVCQNGKKVLVDDYTNCTEAEKNKCLIPKCIYDANTHTSMCDYTDKEPAGNDPCVIYTCLPENGSFIETPKCDDGLYCTEDICTVFGECKHSQVSCTDELDMTGYPCFEARCKEDPINSNYKCVRKLIRNAYIDVCGNCIQEEITSDEGSSSTNASSDVDLLECTGAPAKPLLTEGLAAASIALIILAAVIIGAAIAASGVLGTKTLINRAKGANNQSAHSNPLFEDNEAEMSNPAYMGEN